MDNLTDVAAFVHVVRLGSFTAAADRLGLSKTVISKYVNRLEGRLGARLLNRTTRRLSLTEVGTAFFEQSEAGLNLIDEAESTVARLQGEPRGVLHVSAPTALGVLQIVPALTDLTRRHPQLKVDLNMDDRFTDLIREQIDVAIRIGDLPDSSFVACHLAPCRHVVCGAPHYFRRHGIPQAPEALARHNCLIYRYYDTPNDWRFVLPTGESRTVRVSGNLRANNSLALREAMLGEAGIGMVPTYLVGDDIHAGRLQAVLTGYRLRETSIHAIYPHRLHLSPKIRVFVDFIAGRLGERPDWDTFNHVSGKSAARRASTDSVAPAHYVRKRSAKNR